MFDVFAIVNSQGEGDDMVWTSLSLCLSPLPLLLSFFLLLAYVYLALSLIDSLLCSLQDAIQVVTASHRINLLIQNIALELN